jgi:Superinfection immunity protein/Protein of unknown function (DUF2510)
MSQENVPMRDTEPLHGIVHPAPPPPSAPLAPVAQPYAPAVQAPGYAISQTKVTRPAVGGVHIAIAWVFTVFTFGYFLPWAIAATRNKSNTLAIGVLNFFVGWTIIGWIAALVMACSHEGGVQVNNIAYAAPALPMQPTPQASAAPGWYPEGAGQRYWDGQRWTEHTAR